MHFYHQTIIIQLVSDSAQTRHTFGVTTHMTGVQQHRYIGTGYTHLVRHLPIRLMTASSMHRHHRHSRRFQTLDIAQPQGRVGIHRILDKDAP